MKRLFLISILGVICAFASAQFNVDDTDFDYFDADDGYTLISFADGVFTLSFSDHALPGSDLKISDIDMLPLDEDEDFTQAAMLRHLPAEADSKHLEITYPDASLEHVMADYDAQLTGLGFTRDLEQSSANQSVLRYTQGETTARVVFTRHGEDVTVYMHIL